MLGGAPARDRRTGEEMESTAALLNEDEDKYSLVRVDAKRKWVVVGLTEAAIVDTLVISNLEQYSLPGH